ncbi:MAG: fibronectin type III domain-containing protein [Propionicimonas sp.]
MRKFRVLATPLAVALLLGSVAAGGVGQALLATPAAAATSTTDAYRVYAWGANGSGQSTLPSVLSEVSGVDEVSAGQSHSLALKDGEVLAWGSNSYGQIDVPTDAQSGVSAIAAGKAHSLALRDGAVIAWGSNSSGQIDVPADAQSGVSAIAAGKGFSLALKDGAVIVWGTEGSENAIADVPTAALSGVDAIAAGDEHALALKDGRVTAWGSDTAGQTRVPTDALSGVDAISAGTGYSLALKNGRVLAWGNNYHSVLDVPDAAKAGVDEIAAGGYFALALEDGKVTVWGDEDYSVTDLPTAFAGAEITRIAAGLNHALAIRNFQVPTAPRNVAVGREVQALKVDWTTPSDTDDLPVLSYTVQVDNGQGCTTTGRTDCTIIDLADGTQYSGTVTATTAAGVGAAASFTQMTAGVPDAPTGVSVSRGVKSLKVSWKAPADSGGVPIWHYNVELYSGQGCVVTDGTSCTITGLEDDTYYEGTITAVNSLGAGPSVGFGQTTASLPSEPTSVTTSRGIRSLTVLWRAPGDTGGISIDHYTVKLENGRTCTISGSNSCTFYSLSDNTRYDGTVTATNAVGTGPAASFSGVTVGVPGAPTAVKAVPGNGSASVYWTAPSSNGGSAITKYTVTASPGGQTCTTTGSSSKAPATTCKITGLRNGTSYTFSVRATNAVGTGPSAASAAVIPGPPVPVAVSGWGHQLRVDAKDMGDLYWTFVVQKRASNGTWVNQKTYNTEGRSETKTITLSSGTYRVYVYGKYGYSAAVSNSVSLPTATVVAAANSTKSKFTIDVNPNMGSGYWTFQVQKRASNGSWTTLSTKYKTEGSSETKTINLSKGTYRVRVDAKYGYSGATSNAVTLNQ